MTENIRYRVREGRKHHQGRYLKISPSGGFWAEKGRGKPWISNDLAKAAAERLGGRVVRCKPARPAPRTVKLFNDSDSNFSTHPGDVWSLDQVDTSLDPWAAEDLATVAALAVGESVHLPDRDVTVKRLPDGMTYATLAEELIAANFTRGAFGPGDAIPWVRENNLITIVAEEERHATIGDTLTGESKTCSFEQALAWATGDFSKVETPVILESDKGTPNDPAWGTEAGASPSEPAERTYTVKDDDKVLATGVSADGACDAVASAGGHASIIDEADGTVVVADTDGSPETLAALPVRLDEYEAEKGAEDL